MRKVLLLLLGMILLGACSAPESPQSAPFLEKIDYGLGTVIRIKLYDKQSPEVIDQILQRIEEIEDRMSYTREGSDIYRINHAAGEELSIHADTYAVLGTAIEYSRLSDGLFDPSLGKLIDAWGIGGDEPRIPSAQEIELGLASRGVSKIELLPDNRVRVAPGTEVDLGAIAKGYAADEARRICIENGVQSAIIDLGGNILVVGDKSGENFVIGIRNPFAEISSHLGTLPVQSISVVTSGDYERFFEADGVRYHHILDVRTGYPVQNDLASVSIITERSIDADAYSTSVYAMGLESGREFVESQPGVEAIFVTHDKHVIISSGLKNIFKLTDNTFSLLE